MTRRCEYCRIENDGLYCLACGAPLPDKRLVENRFQKSDPFAYNGYIVWVIKDLMYRKYEIYFYRGIELIDVIEVYERAMREMVPEYCDAMPFIWDLFCLSQGMDKMIEIKTPDRKRFEIRVSQ